VDREMHRDLRAIRDLIDDGVINALVDRSLES